MKRLLLIGGGLAALGLAALVLLWTARIAVVSWGIERVLADRGQTAQLTVTDVTPNALVLSGIKTDELSAGEVLVRFSLPGLLTGRLEGVTVSGLRARLDLPGAEGGGPLTLPPLPPILLRDAVFSIDTPEGLLRLRVDGRVLNPQEGIISAELNTLLETPYADFRGPMSLLLEDLEPLALDIALESGGLALRDLSLGPASVEAKLSEDRFEARLLLEDPRNEGTIGATLASFSERRGINLSSSLSLAPTSQAWRLLPATDLSGSARLEGAIELPRLPGAASFAGLLASPAGLLARLQGLGAQTRLEASVVALSLPESPRPMDAHLTLAQGAGGLAVDASVGEPGAATHIALEGDFQPAADGLEGQIAFRAAGVLDDPLLAAFLPDGTAGEFSASGRLTGRLPEELPPGVGGWLTLGLRGDLRLDAAGLTWPGMARDGMAGLDIALAQDEAALTITLAEDSRLSATPLDSRFDAFLPAGGAALVLTPDGGPYVLSVLPGTKAPLLEGDGRLALELGDARVTQAGRFTTQLGKPLEFDSRYFRLDAQQLSLPGARLDSASFDGSLDFRGGSLHAAGKVDAVTALQGLAGLSAERVLLSGPLAAAYDAGTLTLSSDGAVDLTLETGLRHSTIEVAPAETISVSGLSLSYAGALTGATADVALPALSLTKPQRLEAGAGGALSLSLTEGGASASLSLPSARLLERDLSLDGVTGTVSLTSLSPLSFGPVSAGPLSTGPGAESPSLALSVATVRHPALAPASITLTGKPGEDAPDSLDLSGRLSFSGGAASLPLAGQLRPASRALSFRAGGNTLVFGPDGLQPDALSPLLSAVERAAGDVTPSVYLALDESGLRASGSLRFDGFDFRNGGTAVNAINGTVAFTDLLNPRTDGVQEVTAARVDPAFPIRDIVVRFSVAPGPSGDPLVTIESLDGRSEFGPVKVTEGQLAPLTRSGNLRIALPRLDLSQLTALLGVEGLSATGTLSGSLPVSLENGVVKIDRGSLDDQEQGVIRYESTTARQALAGGGESVTLMLDALENFQYQDFGVSLDKPSADELTLSFSLEGKNPDVLEGYPFRFNINLTTNPNSLLEALRQGSDIGKLLLERQGTFPSDDP